MDLMLDTEALEELLDGEPMCEWDHEALAEEGWEIPCAIVATWLYRDCELESTLTCSMIIDAVKRDVSMGRACFAHGTACLVMLPL